MKTDQTQLFKNQAAATSQASDWVDARGLYCLSIHAIPTGTVTGSIQLQGSNELSSPQNPVNVGAATTISGNTGVNYDGFGYRWVRVNFTAGGTGKFDLWFFGKGA